MSGKLLEAYRATRYEVDGGDDSFVLRIDQPCEALDRLHAEHDVNSSAFITAWNPGSRLCSAGQNRRAQQELVALVDADEMTWLPGRGVDPQGEWPDEAGLLVLGMDRSSALELARRFDQNAVVWTGEDAIPRLLFTSEP